MADFNAEVLVANSDLQPTEGRQETPAQILFSAGGGSTIPPIGDLGFDTGMQKS